MSPRMIRIELRRSALLIWIAPLLFTVLGLVFTKTLGLLEKGRLTWSSSIFYNIAPALALVSTLALATAAWQGGRERRRGMTELFDSTPRPRSHRASVSWLPVVAWPVLAYLPAVLAFGLLSMRAVSGPPLFGVLAAAVPMTSAYTALGFVIGWYVPGRFTAPVAGVATFGVTSSLGLWGPTGLFSALPQPTYGTIASNRLSVGLWDQPVWWFAPTTALWFAMVTTVLLLMLTRRRWLVVLPLAIAALVVVPMLRTQMWRIDTTSSLLACSDGPVRVCVPTTTGFELGAVAASTSSVRTRLAELPAVAPQGENRAYVWPQRCRVRLDQVSCESSSTTSPSAAGRKLAEQTSGWKCPTPAEASPLAPTYTSPVPRLQKGVEAWLLGGSGSTAPEVTQRLASMNPDKRQAWLGRYLVAAESCDRSAVDALWLR